ncbi:MAG: AMIN domain-containing protein [Bdellovibrionales bacterium]|nr:AMIN domain-containing protein [Bdellovibrionales bacterium]
MIKFKQILSTTSHSLAICGIIFILVDNLLAQTLVNQNSKGVNIKVEQSDSELELRLSGPSYTQSSVFKLSSPARIVADLEGNFPKINKSFKLSGDPQFKELRLGSHPGSLRIVLELSSTEVPSYTSSGNTNTFILTTKRQNSIVTTKPKIFIDNQTSTQETLPNSSGALSGLANTNIQTSIQNDPELQRPAIGSPEPIQDDVPGASMTDITFIEPKADTELGALQITLTDRDSFTLIRTDQKEYKLIFSNTSKSILRTELPYFPPQYLRGITVVTPIIENSKLSLRIGIDRGYRLRASSSENQIIIRPTLSKWTE